jgi:hypothetical protein
VIAPRVYGLFVSIALAALCAGVASAAEHGTWSIEPGSPGNVQFALRFDDGSSHDSNSAEVPVEGLYGLSPHQLASNGAHVTFTLVRDAGTFHCDGWAEGGRASGVFAFDVDPHYVQEMNSMGFGNLSHSNVIAAAMLDISTAYVRGMRAAGYPNVSFSNLLALRALHIDEAYIARVKAHGIKAPTVNDLIRLKAMDII